MGVLWPEENPLLTGDGKQEVLLTTIYRTLTFCYLLPNLEVYIKKGVLYELQGYTLH